MGICTGAMRLQTNFRLIEGTEGCCRSQYAGRAPAAQKSTCKSTLEGEGRSRGGSCAESALPIGFLTSSVCNCRWQALLSVRLKYSVSLRLTPSTLMLLLTLIKQQEGGMGNLPLEKGRDIVSVHVKRRVETCVKIETLALANFFSTLLQSCCFVSSSACSSCMR